MRAAVLFGIAGLLIASTAGAHHGRASYHESALVSFEGRVTAFALQNPH